MKMMKIIGICIVGLTIVGCTPDENNATLGAQTTEYENSFSSSNMDGENIKAIIKIIETENDIMNIECLAKNIYFEARSESKAGKIAVANVTMNRTESEKFPDDVCGVVYQKKQFSWTNKLKNKTPKNVKVYKEIYNIAEAVYYNQIVDITDGALFYHTNEVKPSWSKEMEKVAVIDNHIFYKLKDS